MLPPVSSDFASSFSSHVSGVGGVDVGDEDGLSRADVVVVSVPLVEVDSSDS